AATNLGAGGAGVHVKVRAALHEVGCRLADFRAIEHQPDVVRLHVPSALLEAVHECFLTGLVAVLAQLDAGEHVLTEITSVRFGHGGSAPYRNNTCNR